jgi:hypothetical protein
LKQEGQRGILFDMAARVDPQGHKEECQFIGGLQYKSKNRCNPACSGSPIV